jgi:hypothetical protein
MRYEAVRSNTDKSLHVICMDGAFENLPHSVRRLGPWQEGLGVRRRDGALRRSRGLHHVGT